MVTPEQALALATLAFLAGASLGRLSARPVVVRVTQVTTATGDRNLPGGPDDDDGEKWKNNH